MSFSTPNATSRHVWATARSTLIRSTQSPTSIEQQQRCARAEREVLSDYNLSFGGFTILWVLWVWDDMEAARLAHECNLAKGTLTGMVTTLEKQGLVERTRVESDRRRVTVKLTPQGTNTIDELFPRFNKFEGAMSNNLTVDEKRELARLLRLVITGTAGAATND